jgi:hypothetical protein
LLRRVGACYAAYGGRCRTSHGQQKQASSHIRSGNLR